MKPWMKTFLLSLAASLVVAGGQALAGTVILSTTTYPGPDPTVVSPMALPGVGAYTIDVVVKSTAAVKAFTSVDLYLQQEGIAGPPAYYTIFNSTITQCTGVCSRYIVPDIYLGGNLRALWTIVGSSATIIVTARPVTP